MGRVSRLLCISGASSHEGVFVPKCSHHHISSRHISLLIKQSRGYCVHLRARRLDILHQLKRLLYLILLHVIDDKVKPCLRDDVNQLRENLLTRREVDV